MSPTITPDPTGTSETVVNAWAVADGSAEGAGGDGRRWFLAVGGAAGQHRACHTESGADQYLATSRPRYGLLHGTTFHAESQNVTPVVWKNHSADVSHT